MTSQADSPPSWPQPPIPTQLLYRRRSASALLTMPVIIVLISIPALVLSFFAIPHVFSMSNQLWKGTVGIRRGWDSLIIVLVIFAVLCGIFAPRRGDEAAAEEASRASANTRSSSPKAEKALEMTAEQWFQSIDRRIYELPEERAPVDGISRLRRNYGSYPDPTQESWPLMGEGRLRFFDDSAVGGHYQRLDQPARVHLRRWQSAIDESEIKEIPVDTFVRGSLSPPSVASPEQAKLRPPPNPPPPPPPPNATPKKRSAYDFEAVGETMAPPPPPPPPLPTRREQSPVRIERRKSSATAELKVIIASVLSANKRKKRRPKATTIEESANVSHSMDETPDRRIPRPPPPPPPPQPQSFLSIFKKTRKTRRIHSASAQPPHPPPHPAEHGRLSTASRSTKPPLPKIPKKNREDRSTRHPSGIPMAPSPPSSFSPDRRRRSRESGIAETDGDVSWSPPKVGMKRATSSSVGDGAKWSGHVDGEDVVKGGPGTALCESPDVNAKADTFIARLKDGWRLERMNSIREKHGLGIGSGPL